MPFPMKIQPIDFNAPEASTCYESVKPVLKSRFKRLFERQFQNFLRISAPEKPLVGNEEEHCNKDGSEKFGPSSVCLAKMVQNFIEESNEKQSVEVRCGRKRCNCFTGNSMDSSEDEFDSTNCFGESNHTSFGDTREILKSLVPCATVTERNLLADIAKIVERNKVCKRKDDFSRKIVTDGLLASGYDSSICKSRWDKSPLYPAGAYDYVDVIIEGERLIVDIDFRSEFEIARSTKTYKAILQTLPQIFVGKADRLQKIICIVSEAAKQSLQKKGIHVPPWRKAEYVKAKWLSPCTRITPEPTLAPTSENTPHETDIKSEKEEALTRKKSSCGDFVLIFGEKSSPAETDNGEAVFTLSDSSVEEDNPVVVKQWEPPEIKPRSSSQIRVKMVTGLASVIEDNP
ncbi:unnamed protein product [Ilex paraguariensis]|uniref:Uncharacterized protein n=1 Tax=Ilex paraguariensis TaxID=185542 RepID=A0ABC8RJP5_9AQUA